MEDLRIKEQKRDGIQKCSTKNIFSMVLDCTKILIMREKVQYKLTSWFRSPLAYSEYLEHQWVSCSLGVWEYRAGPLRCSWEKHTESCPEQFDGGVVWCQHCLGKEQFLADHWKSKVLSRKQKPGHWKRTHSCMNDKQISFTFRSVALSHGGVQAPCLLRDSKYDGVFATWQKVLCLSCMSPFL